MCHITMTLRYDLSKDLITSNPGVYYNAEAWVDYWEQQTGVRVSLTHVPGVFQALQKNGVSIHCRDKAWCFETEEIRDRRLTREAQIKEEKILAQAEKDLLLWVKKCQRRDELKELLRVAEVEVKAIEDSRGDSILLAEYLKKVA